MAPACTGSVPVALEITWSRKPALVESCVKPRMSGLPPKSTAKTKACELSSTIAWGLVPVEKELPSAVRARVLLVSAIEKPAMTPVEPLDVWRLTT